MENKINCFLDGKLLCIVRKDFINLQESECVFIELDPEILKEVEDLTNGK